MAKKSKIPLFLNEIEIRDIRALRENFDVAQLKKYVLDGTLWQWLDERYYEDESDKVEALTKDDPELENKLYEIFNVKKPEDPEIIAWRNERLAVLKGFTEDPAILAKVDNVAFDQEELSDLIDDDVDEIYLCNGRFRIPLKVENKTYIGVGDVMIVIHKNEPIDFDALNIHFENIKFNPEYEEILKKVVKEETPETLFELGLAAEQARSYSESRDCFEKAAAQNYVKAMNKLGKIYYDGIGTDQNYDKAIEWFTKAAEAGDRAAMSQLASMYKNGEGVKKDFTQAMHWYHEAAKVGSNTESSNAESAKEVKAADKTDNYEGIVVDGNSARAVTRVINRTGVHSRPAYAFVQTASKFKSKVQVAAKGKKFDVKNILNVMALGLSYGTEMTIIADGPDALDAVKTLKDLVDDGFGEEM